MKTFIQSLLSADNVAQFTTWSRGLRQRLPASRAGRTGLGLVLVLGGLLSFLPLLGIWMLPLGLVIMSIDWPSIRRLRRKSEVRILRRWKPESSAA